jgi:hypothetical protein
MTAVLAAGVGVLARHAHVLAAGVGVLAVGAHEIVGKTIETREGAR